MNMVDKYVKPRPMTWNNNLRLGGWWHCGLAALLGLLPTMAIAQAQITAPPLAPASAPVVFRGVTVVDVREGKRLPAQTVVVVGHQIQSIAPAGETKVPRGAQVIDARGKYLIPGLWDMHVHPMQYTDIAYPLYIANGVTGVRDAGSNVPLVTFRQWKREIAAGTRIGPRLIVSGPSLGGIASPDPTKVVQGTNNNDTHFLYVPLADARRVVDSLKAAGADMLKIYDPPHAERLVMAAEARRIGIPFGGHSPDMPGVDFSDSGATFLDHQTWTGVCGEGEVKGAQGDIPFDVAQCAAAAQRLRHNNTWVTTMSTVDMRARIVDRVRRYIPVSFPNHWPLADSEATARVPTSTAEWAKYFVPSDGFSRLVKAGVPIAIGTDGGINAVSFLWGMTPGFAVHQTLVSLVLTGMTPLAALQTATLNPALALRASDSLGTVAAGKVADLVLLDADPLADIWNTTKIRAVVANGRYYDRAALDGLLVQAEQAAAHQ